MTTVLAHGVFDLLHSGHVDHLEQCKAFGDKLIVSVVSDRFVSKRYLINDEATRMKMVMSLKVVNGVFLCDDIGPQELLKLLKPDIYARNDEYEDRSKPEFEICDALGIACKFTVTHPPHTADLVARIKAL